VTSASLTSGLSHSKRRGAIKDQRERVRKEGGEKEEFSL
jgi:hypothetical protein